MKLNLDLIPNILISVSFFCYIVLAIRNIYADKKLREHDKSRAAFRKEINLFRSADLQLGKSIADLIELVKKLEARQDKLEMKLMNQGGYNQGLKILEMGGDIKDIIDTCHLSKAEAELLCNLHDYKEAQCIER